MKFLLMMGTLSLARLDPSATLERKHKTWTGRSWTWFQDPATFVCAPCCSCDRNWLSITFMVVPKALDLRLSDFICWHQAWTQSSCFGEPRWKRTFADKELGEPFPLVRNRVTEVAGMKKEMESMVSFDVFSEVPCLLRIWANTNFLMQSPLVGWRLASRTAQCVAVLIRWLMILIRLLQAPQVSRLWSFFWHFQLHLDGMFQLDTSPLLFCMLWSQVKTFMSLHLLNTIRIRTWSGSCSWSVHLAAWRVPQDFGKTTCDCYEEAQL